MNTKEAKDFIVQETVVQSSLESISLSDLERRMMYFSENDPVSCSDPLNLNEKFQEQYDTDEYETKMSLLLQHAYERLKKENPEKISRWNQALQILNEGDHYLLVLWPHSPATIPSPPSSIRDRVLLLVIGLLIAMGVLLAFLALKL